MPIILEQQHKEHKKPKKIEQYNIKCVLQSIKQQSEKYLDSQQQNDVKSALILKQSLAYQLTLLSPQEYIAHQFTKVKNMETRNQSLIGIDLLNRKFLFQYQLHGKAQDIVIKNVPPYQYGISSHQSAMSQSLNSLNNQLKQKLSQINSNLSSISKPSMKMQASRSYSFNNRNIDYQQKGRLQQINKQRMQQQMSRMIQFKQPSYWIKNQQKTKKIKQFLEHHQKEQQKMHKKHQQQMDKCLKRIQEQSNVQRQAKIESKRQITKKGLQKSLQYRQKRQFLTDKHQNQLQKVQQFLQRINLSSNSEKKRLYVILEQKYKQQLQAQRQRYSQKLARIKQQHSPFDQQDLDQHIQKYQQYKQSLNQQLKTKKQQFQSQRQQIAEQQKNMFHSKRYDKIAEEQITPHKRSMSEILQRNNRKKDFSLSVVQKFKPTISKQKRQSLQDSIKELTLTEDKTKKKVFKNGHIQYEDKAYIDGRKKGIQYLAFLRKYLENKPKKQDRSASTSIIQSSKVKRMDYLRENKPKIKFKATMIEWKKVIEDPDFKAKDKYTFLKQSISTLEHKAFQKQVQARNLKKSGQQFQKKQQFDKLYLQSIEAKMAILNNLMLSKGARK